MLHVQSERRKTVARGVLFVTFLLNSALALFAQDRVTGTVTDRAGEPLAGVNVLVKGTTTGGITGLDGTFAVEAGRGGTLVFTFIGFIRKEIRADRPVVDVVLEEDNQTLDEVVVVGYGVMTRKDVTSSITTVSADKLNVGVYSDPAQLLQGKVPGLTVTQSSNPNATPSITLRGASTLREGAAMEPYYVVDGIPGVSLSLISPDDIESVDVLRDATATAIYGSKAANGVIIVTTKKGKAGHTNVGYSGYVAVDNVMKNYDVMNAAQLRSYAASSQIVLPNDLGADTRWQDEVQRTGFSHNHNVSISGGSEHTTYSAGINYMERRGVIKGTAMDRLIGRTFLQAKALNDRLTLSFNINTSITGNHDIPMDTDGRSVLDAMYYYSPLVPVRNDDGSWYENSGISQNHNPVALISENIYDTESKRIYGTGKASLEIAGGLVFNLSLAYQNEQYIYSKYNTSNSLIASGMNGRAERASVANGKKILETYLNYDRTFNRVHKLGLMGGYSWEESNDNDGFQLTTYGYYNDALTYYNMGMANHIDKNGLGNRALSTLRMISFYGRLNYAYAGTYLFQATVRRDGSSAFGKNNRWAVFPSASLAWRLSEEGFIKDLDVFDDLKLRAGYGVSGNSLGFDVFTATQIYGSTGRYDHLTSTGESEQVHILGATRNANPDLKWERTGMFNAGIDMSFFNNRLNGTIEYYDKRTKDLIADYAVSTTKYPYSQLTANVGEISNRGIELTINAVPVKTKDLTWETSLNLSHNRNKVVRLSNAMYSVDYFDKASIGSRGFSGATTQRIMEGYPIGQFYVWKWAGVEDGISHFYVYGESSLTDVYKDRGGFEGKVTRQADGRYTDNATGEYVTTAKPLYDDRTAAGSAQPKLNMGWNNTLSYKDWTLTLFVQGLFGNKILNASRAYLSNVGMVVAGQNVLASIADEHPATDNNAHAPSDRYLEDGSYLRLSSLTLGYNFGRLNNYVKELRLYATCNNLLTITGYKGIDPEVNLGGIQPGIDNRQTYPRTRTFMLGANINF
ncbi:MAG: TonB-dependent receptor [Mediterranea sp.]|jgi:iron complex outermembrane receptor protein|nr:TonB-dependent receptor [Mediterranea sp.]